MRGCRKYGSCPYLLAGVAGFEPHLRFRVGCIIQLCYTPVGGCCAPYMTVTTTRNMFLPNLCDTVKQFFELNFDCADRCKRTSYIESASRRSLSNASGYWFGRRRGNGGRSTTPRPSKSYVITPIQRAHRAFQHPCVLPSLPTSNRALHLEGFFKHQLNLAPCCLTSAIARCCADPKVGVPQAIET